MVVVVQEGLVVMVPLAMGALALHLQLQGHPRLAVVVVVEPVGVMPTGG